MTERMDFADGKYTVINENGKLTALRHGELWGRDLTGDNLIYWMLMDALKLKAERDALAAKLAELVDERVIDRTWVRFCGAFGDGPDAPYPGMIAAFETHYGQSFRDKEWRTEAACWAAAWSKAAARAEASLAEPQPGANSAPIEAIRRILTEVMDEAARNGAGSRSMPDDYVEVAAWLCGVSTKKASQPDALDAATSTA